MPVAAPTVTTPKRHRSGREDARRETANTIVFDNGDGSLTAHVYPRQVNERNATGQWRRIAGALPATSPDAARSSLAAATPNASGGPTQTDATEATWVDGSSAHYGSHVLDVANTANSFVKFGLSSATPGLGKAYVLTASLALDTTYSRDCTTAHPVYVAPITSPWDARTLHDYPGPDTAPRIGSSSWSAGVNCPKSPRAFHAITIDPRIVTTWLHGTAAADYGLAITTPEAATAGYELKEFSADDPYLSLTYTPTGNGATYTENTYASPWNNKTGWGQVTVRNEGSVSWSSSGFDLGYEIYDVSGTTRTVKYDSTYPAALPRVVQPSQAVTVTATLPAIPPPATGHSWEVCWDMRNGTTKFSSERVPPRCYALPVVNNAPIISSLLPANNAVIYSPTPALLTTANDPDAYPGTPLTYTYSLYDSSSSTALKTVTSTSAAFAVPPGLLKYGHVYYWTVSVSDGKSASPTSAPSYFSIPSPAQPLVTSHLGAAPYDNTTNGVDRAAGDYSTAITDARVPGGSAGPPIAVTRTYNSLDPRLTTAFGAGWASTLDMRATPDVDGTGNVVITLADGREERFGKNTDGSFSAPQGVKSSLVTYPVGSSTPTGYRLTDAEHSTYVFDITGKDPVTGQSFYGLDNIGGNGSAGYLTLQWEQASVAGMSGNTLLPVSMYGPGTSHPRLEISWSSESITTNDGSTVDVPHVAAVRYGLNPGQPATPAPPADTWTYSYNTANQLSGVCSPATPDKCTAYTYTSGAHSGSHFSAMVSDSNPASYWRLNDPAGAATAADSVAANENSTAAVNHGATFGADGHLPGTVATSASFDGASSFIALPSSLIKGVNLSVGTWFKMAPGSTGTLLSYQNQPVDSTTLPTWRVPALYVGGDGKLRGEFWDGAASPITSPTRVDDGKWHYVVLSGEGQASTNKQTLFLDGAPTVRNGTAPIVATPTGTFVTAGAGYSGGWPSAPAVDAEHGYFTGQLSDVWFAQHPTGLPAAQQEYAAGITSASELTSTTSPGGHKTVALEYDDVADRAVKVTDADGGTWTIPVPITTGSTGYYRGRVAATRPDYVYPLDEQSGVSAVYAGVDRPADGSKDGTYNNVTLGEPGIFGPDGDTAAGFDGKDSFVDLKGASLYFGDSFTVALWFRTTTAGGTLLSQQNTPIGTTPSAHTALLYVGTDGKLHSSGYPSYPFPTPVAGKTTVTDGQWHLVELEQSVTDSQQEVLYLDGKVDASQVPYTTQPDYHQYIDSVGAGFTDKDDAGSAYATNPQGWFNGDIAEVGIYDHRVDTALAGGIRSLYAARGSSTSLLPTTRVQVTDPNGHTETDDLDPAAGFRLIAHTDALGNTTRYSYDTRGFREATTDPDGHTTTLAHDGDGNVTTTVTCRNTTSCQKATATFEPSTNPTDYAAGKMLTYSDPRTYDGAFLNNTKPGFVTTYTYNAQGLLATRTEPATSAAPNGRKFTYAYTTPTTPAADGGTQIGNQLASATDPNGSKTSYTYYSGGQLATITSPTGAVTKYEYTQDSYGPAARVVTDSSYPAGLRTTYTYDAENRPLTETAPQTTDAVTGAHHQLRTTYAYDDDGNVRSVTLSDVAGNDAARTTTYTYTGDRHLASTTDPDGNKTAYDYDALGERSATTLPDGDKIAYGYSATGELQTITLKDYVGDPNAPSSAADLVLESRAYDPAGRLASTTDAMGRTTAYAYLDDGLLAETRHAVGTASETRTQRQYDAVGNVTVVGTGCGTVESGQPGSRLVRSFYDAANRVIEYDIADTSDAMSVHGFSYDAAGNVTKTTTETADTSTLPAKVTDPHVTTQTWDAGDNLQTTATENGSATLTTTYARDTSGRLLSATSPAGRKISYAYDEAGQQVTLAKPAITDGQSGTTITPTWTTGRDTFGEVDAARDADGNITTDTYDGDGNVTKQTGASYQAPASSTSVTPSISYTYDSMSRPASQTDALNYKQTATYDQLGDVAKVTLPGGAVQTSTYDRDGETLSTTTPSGARTEQTYDALGDQVTATSDERYPTPSADTTTFGRDRLGQKVSETDPLGNKTTYAYDEIGDQVSTTLPTGEKLTTGYNALGEATSETAPDGTKGITTYDEANRVTGTQNLAASGAVLSSTSATYDADGNPLTTTDASGHVLSSTYDADENLVKQTEPDGNGGTNTTSFGYDAMGNRTSYQDPNGYTTGYTYNSLGLQESSILPAVAGDTALADRATTVSYDADARPVKTTRPGGVSISRDYNVAGELSRLTGAGAAAPERDYTYDSDGRLTKATSGSTTVTETYEDRGQVLTSSDGGGSASMSYDADDNLRSRTDAAGSATFDYDADNRLVKQAGPSAGTATAWTYTPAGQVDKTTYQGVATVGYTYDGQHRVTGENVSNTAGSSVAKYTWARNAAGQVTSEATACASNCTPTSTTYTYDGLGRLASAKSGSATTNYAYDADGNLTKGDGFAGSYNEQDELTSSTSSAGASTYKYSLRGTPDSTTDPGGTTSTTSFDAYDELTSAGGRSYSYDALGRVATASGGGTSNTFGYDGLGAEPVSDGVQSFGRTPAGAPVTSTSGGSTTDLVTDDHGDVVAQVAAGGLAGSAGYSAFGTAASAGSSRTALGFQGGWSDAANGDVVAGSRWYSPVLARFLSADTVQNEPTPAVNANRYAYGNDDPLDRSDRSGHGACTDYEDEAVEEAEEHQEEARLARQDAEVNREVRQIAREGAEEPRERPWDDEDQAREERESRAEEREWDEERFEEEHNGRTEREYREELKAEEWEDAHPAEPVDEPWYDDVLEDAGEVLEDGAEFAVENPELLAFESYEPPSRAECGSAAKPEEVTPKHTVERAQRAVDRAVDEPESAPAEDPAARAASQPRTYHPSESGDATTDQTATQDETGGLDSEAADQPPSDGGKSLSIRYKEGWTDPQREAADAKVEALNDAAGRGELRVTRVQRAGTSAAARYRAAGNEIPEGADIDHTIDLQLGGLDELLNMSPLDLSVNRSLGAQIGGQLRGLSPGARIIELLIGW